MHVRLYACPYTKHVHVSRPYTHGKKGILGTINEMRWFGGLICNLGLFHFTWSSGCIYFPENNAVLYLKRKTWVSLPQFPHSLADRPWHWLHNKVIIKSATVKMDVQASLGHVGLGPFRHISRNATITGHTVILVQLLRELHTDFHSDHPHFQEPLLKSSSSVASMFSHWAISLGSLNWISCIGALKCQLKKISENIVSTSDTKMSM